MKPIRRKDALVIVLAALFFFALGWVLVVPSAECNPCYGGPCNTSAACVTGCHCIEGLCR